MKPFLVRAKAVFFSIALHGAILVLLLYSFHWTNPIQHGGAEPMQAVLVSEQDVSALVEKQQQLVERKKRAEEEKRRAEQRKQEAKKLAAEKKRHAEQQRQKQKQLAEQRKQEAKKRAAEKKRQEDEERRRAEQLRQRLEQEQLAKTRQDAHRALSALIDRIVAKVERNWRKPPQTAADLSVTIQVKVDRGGQILFAKVVQSSGDRFFDQSAELAVRKSSPLPFPSNPKYYELINQFNLKFKP